MRDLLSHHATLPGGRRGMSIAVREGHILEVTPGHLIEALDAQGFLVSPPFVDAHFHMDATLSYGLPRVNQSGTLLDGIALWGELKPLLEVKRRVAPTCTWSWWRFRKTACCAGRRDQSSTWTT